MPSLCRDSELEDFGGVGSHRSPPGRRTSKKVSLGFPAIELAALMAYALGFSEKLKP